MVQSGSVFTYWVTLQDRSGSPLWGGSEVKCFCTEETYAGNIMHGMTPKTMPTTPDFVGSNSGSVWQNLIVNNSFSGLDNPKITIKGGWATDLGSYVGTTPLMTPYKLAVMAASGRTYYLKDERIIRQMMIESGSQFYGANGVPVVITDYAMSANGTSDRNLVSWSINMREDKV